MIPARVESFLAILAGHSSEQRDVAVSEACSSGDAWVPEDEVREWALQIWDQLRVFLYQPSGQHPPEGLEGQQGQVIQVQDNLEEVGHSDQETVVTLPDGPKRKATALEKQQLADKEKRDEEESERQKQGDLQRWDSSLRPSTGNGRRRPRAKPWQIPLKPSVARG